MVSGCQLLGTLSYERRGRLAKHSLVKLLRCRVAEELLSTAGWSSLRGIRRCAWPMPTKDSVFSKLVERALCLGLEEAATPRGPTYTSLGRVT